MCSWPGEGRAQQRATPVMECSMLDRLARFKSFLRAFRQGLNESGYVEGENVTLEYR
jgi:putative ABC transport system substrate-binding protein